MRLTNGHHGSLSRVGGQPTLLPITKPWPKVENRHFGFIMQLQVDPFWLRLPGIAYLQIYQTLDESDDPLPMVLSVPPDAPPNQSLDVAVHPLATAWDIGFELRDEPAQLPKADFSPESLYLFKSKLGGLDPWERDLHRIFLGQITEQPVGLNFAGMVCCLYLEKSGLVVTELN